MGGFPPGGGGGLFAGGGGGFSPIFLSDDFHNQPTKYINRAIYM